MMPALNKNAAPMTDIHDIKPALAIATHWPWWVWLSLVLGLAVLALLAWWLKQRLSNKNQATAPTEPPMSPDTEAFQHLDLLAAKGSDDPKRFYFSLSAILRRYVERRYDFPAAEMTTEELLPCIQRLDMTDALVDGVKRFCRHSDPIKFADAASDQAGMSKDLAFVRQFVEQTTKATQEGSHEKTDINGVNPAQSKPLPYPNPLPGKLPQPENQTPDTEP